MEIIDIPQGSDQWHLERWRAATGTRFQSAIGAVMSSNGEMIVGGIKWAIINGKIERVELLTKTELKKCDGNPELKRELEYKAIAVNKVRCAAIQETLMLEMISENRSILEIDEYQSPEMLRGHEMEPLSISEAAKRLKVEFSTVGMLQSDINPLFKFSPDAVHFDKNGVITGGFETKSKAGKKHIEYIELNELPREHFWQCICPMVMSKSVIWWMFAHYDDRDMIDPLFLAGIKRADYAELIELCEGIILNFLDELERRTIKLGGYYIEPLTIGEQ